jgi:hypothetical protein
MEGLTNAVVRNTVLREIVGPYLFGTFPGAYLRTALSGYFLFLFAPLYVQEASSEHGHRLLPVS